MDADDLDRLRGIARRIVRSGRGRPHLDADDLAQEGAVAVLTASRRKRMSGPLSGWVAIRAMRDALSASLRWDAQRAAARLAAARRSPPPALGRDELADLRDALARIDPGHAAAVRLKILDGRTNAECGALLGCCGEVAARRCRAGVAALAAILGPPYAPEYARPVPIREPDLWHARARRVGRKQAPRRTPQVEPGRRRRRAAALLAVIESAR